MGRLVSLGFFMAGCFFLLKGIAALLMLAVTIIMLPYYIWVYSKSKNAEFKRMTDLLNKPERDLNRMYERLYFPEDSLPKSGTLDRNGIPYL